MNRPHEPDRFSRHETVTNDLLATALSEQALASLERRIEAIVVRLLEKHLATELEQLRLTPWLDTKHASAYLGITENALRLRVREQLVPAHRDGAGRLRFHRDELDQSMRPKPDRRRRRRR